MAHDLSVVKHISDRVAVMCVGKLVEVADPSDSPPGCYFHPRCPCIIDICRTDAPVHRESLPGRSVSCHRAEELQLAGVPSTD